MYINRDLNPNVFNKELRMCYILEHSRKIMFYVILHLGRCQFNQSIFIS